MDVERLDKKSFQVGYNFALIVLKAMGFQVPLVEQARVLKAVREGEMELMGSPADIIAEMEHGTGRKLPESLRQSVHEWTSGEQRKANAESHRESAALILDMMGEPPP